MVRERPIPFIGPLVRAILDGRKTQTRRLVKGDPRDIRWCPVQPSGRYDGWEDEHGRALPCPYGVPGDRLWVREAHVLVADPLGVTPGIVYDADDEVRWGVPMREGSTLYNYATPEKWRRRAARFLRTEHARISLEITDVRVERLTRITERDAMAEGVFRFWYERNEILTARPNYRDGFRKVWDEINGECATWKSNPWVWAITFKRVEA